MTYINSIRKAVKFPEAAKRKLAATVTRPFAYGNYPNESHVNRDWDNLILLDACRFDTFVNHNPFDEEVERAISNASHTKDFLENNLTGDQSDTVYVTASPQVTKNESRFHDVIHVWKEFWDEELRTVLPEDVTKAAHGALERYPNKKLIIHYMQPHYPFIGSTGRDLETHATFTGGLRERDHLSIWELLSSGKVTSDRVRRAYRENLEIVLEEVENLIEHIDGKTVLTSDHGNLFGERVSPLPIKLYGHPPNIPAGNLITVPLVELPYEKRRDIQAGESNESEKEHGDVKSRLEDLGYV